MTSDQDYKGEGDGRGQGEREDALIPPLAQPSGDGADEGARERYDGGAYADSRLRPKRLSRREKSDQAGDYGYRYQLEYLHIAAFALRPYAHQHKADGGRTDKANADGVPPGIGAA